MRAYCILVVVALTCPDIFCQGDGRNDGEPDYNPTNYFMELRDGGRNDGEPDYDGGDMAIRDFESRFQKYHQTIKIRFFKILYFYFIIW